MPTETQLPPDHPLIKAWDEYTRSESFTNTKKWVTNPQHAGGSLWAAFASGWEARDAAGDGIENTLRNLAAQHSQKIEAELAKLPDETALNRIEKKLDLIITLARGLSQR